MENYKILDIIGDGTYGTVYKGIDKRTNEYVAIKKMKKKYTDWDECLSLKEVQALINLKHSNIVTLNELILENEELNMIFEFIGVNLFEWTKNIEGEISECKIRNISFQILQGLAYMHKNNFFHRDMKPENILISRDQVKLADFGLAKEIHSNPPFTDYVATRWYRAPEVILNDKNYSLQIDIFALGAIIAELYNGKPLFPGKQASEQMAKICEVLGTPTQSEWPEGYQLANKMGYKFPMYKGHKLKNVIHNASDNAINLLELMLSFNPKKRPDAVQCLQHPFFQCYDLLSFFGLKILNSKEKEQTNSSGKKNQLNYGNGNGNRIFSMSVVGNRSNVNANLSSNASPNNAGLSGSVSSKDGKTHKKKMNFEEFVNS
ncbi:MAG: serine/threonine-protein kinase [archaeon]|nr:serine/threonine-protein kinase [archaeon]